MLAIAQYVCGEMQSGGDPTESALAVARRVAQHRRKRCDVVSLHVYGGLLPADWRAGLIRDPRVSGMVLARKDSRAGADDDLVGLPLEGRRRTITPVLV